MDQLVQITQLQVCFFFALFLFLGFCLGFAVACATFNSWLGRQLKLGSIRFQQKEYSVALVLQTEYL